MKIWVDAQMSPAIARWLTTTFAVEATALRDLGLRDAEDLEIFMAARTAGAIVMTKDVDFTHLVAQHGPPPQILWITCGNTSNARLIQLLGAEWSAVVVLFTAGEPLVEVSERAGPGRLV